MIHHYLNTPSPGYMEICSDKNYVDKSGLIHIINSFINSPGKLILSSWPRRFGKTFSVQMIKAYYTYGYDHRALFCNKAIARLDPALSYLGAFDVLYLDMIKVRDLIRSEQAIQNSKAIGRKKAQKVDWIEFLSDSIIRELADTYGQDIVSEKSLPNTLVNVVQKTGRKFMWICDEWDNFFREPTDDPNAPQKYIELLRSLFKVPDTSAAVFSCAYMTGILPMIKMKGESALTEFRNYTMFSPGKFAPYIGFNEKEVRWLLSINSDCSLSYDELKSWYDGYSFFDYGPLFNPRSVIVAMENNYCDSYWIDSASNAQFKQLISLKKDSLRQDVEKLLKGDAVPVSLSAFDNDLRTLPEADGDGDSATLAAMVHLGYLCFDQEMRTAHIPNREIRMQFLNMLKDSSYTVVYNKIAEADQILRDTWQCNTQRIAEAFREIHHLYSDPRAYNSEATLKEVIDLAYYTAERFYVRMYEIPSGEGYADVIFYPKIHTDVPLLLIELKKNTAPATGLDQIRKRMYPARFREYGGREMFLISISYEADHLEKRHYCIIDRIRLTIHDK